MKTTPKDFFLWIGIIITLYVSAVSLLTLLFQYIDVLFGDVIKSAFYDPFSGAIRFAIASLIVIFPLYIYLTRIINKDIRQNSAKKEIGVRKWLIFLTLFVAGVTIIVDLIVLINTFLGGEEMTYGFILKVLSVLVIMGGVFMYYLYDLRGVWENSEKTSKMIGGIVSALVLSTIIGGFFIIGSPQSMRDIRYDQDKISGLRSIQRQIISFYQQKGELPLKLEDLEDPLVGFNLPKDSQTEKSYKYEVVEGLTFKLCADFNKESRGYEEDIEKLIQLDGNSLNFRRVFDDENWAHGAGEVCFKRTIDPDKFPQIKERF